jgi:hypothetical protein
VVLQWGFVALLKHNCCLRSDFWGLGTEERIPDNGAKKIWMHPLVTWQVECTRKPELWSRSEKPMTRKTASVHGSARQGHKGKA